MNATRIVLAASGCLLVFLLGWAAGRSSSSESRLLVDLMATTKSAGSINPMPSEKKRESGGMKFVEQIGLPTTIYRNSSDYHGPLTGGAVEERCGAFLKKQSPYMRKVEVELFRLQLAKYDNSARYFEWGTGGSTAFASLRTDGTMYSFENQEAWCEKMMAMPYYQCLVSMGKLEYFCAAPIITNAWGKPKRKGDHAYFSSFVFGIDEVPGEFDMVLVDGRFRLACAMAAFSKMHANSSLLFHDYHRDSYHDIEQWFVLVDRSDRLAVLMPKPFTDPPTREQILEEMMKSHK